MKPNTKATLSLAMAASLILALVFTGFGIAMVKKIGDNLNYGFDKSLCKQSAIMNSKYRMPLAEDERFELSCPTRYINIEPNQITFESKNTKKIVPLKGTDISTPEGRIRFIEAINPIIAELNFDCWDQFAAGQLPVLSKYETDRQCVICSRIAFSEEVQVAFGPNWWSGTEKRTSLEEYMATHKPRAVTQKSDVLERDISYLEFTMDPLDTFGRIPYEYDTTQPIAVVFTALNENQVNTLLEKLGDTLKKYVLRDEREKDETMDEFINQMDFIPYSQIKNQCEVLR